MDDLEQNTEQTPRPRNKLRPTTHHWLGYAVALLAFVVYAWTLTPFPFPGESALLITKHTGIDPLRPLSNPIYGMIVRFLADLPVSTLAGKLNFFSAVCGGICVWLVFELGYRFQYDREKAYWFKNMYVLSALVAALFFAVSTPIWYASSRAHFVMFDLMLFMSSVHILTTYRREGGVWRIIAFSLLYSITTVEYPTALLWSIPLGVYLLLQMYKQEDLKLGVLIGILVCGLIGLSLYFIFSWYYYQLPIAEWRRVPSYLKVVSAMGHEQYTSFQRSLPNIGWLSIALMSLFPFLLCTMFANFKVVSTEKKFAIYFFILVIFAIAGAVLFNSIAAPWTMIGHSPLLIAPYALLAIATGWATTLLYTRMLNVDEKGRERQDGGMPPRKALALITLPLSLMIIIAGFVNHPEVEARTAGIISSYADQTLDDLGDRTWMISADSLDDMLAIAAWDRKQTVHFLNPIKDRQVTYRNYNSTLFEDPRRQSLAKIGLGPLISEWFKEDPDLPAKLASEHEKGIWSSRGLLPLQHQSIIRGVPEDAPLDMKAIYAEHFTFWEKFVGPLQALERQKNPAGPYARQILLRLSRNANDLGVLAEERETIDVAQLCYQRARTIFPDNLSALLNEYILLSSNSNLPVDEETIAAAEEELRKEENRIGLPNMVRYFGYIRSYEAVQRLQEFWNIQAPTPVDRSPIKAIEAAFVADDLEQALKLARSYVEDYPNNELGWNLLAVVAGKHGDEATLYDCLKKMNELERQWPFLLELLGRYALDKNDLIKGRRFLEQALRYAHGNVRLLELLLQVDMQERNMRRGREHAMALLAIDPGNATGNMVLGMIHFTNKEYNLAANAFQESIARKPQAITLNNLAWIYHLQEKDERALLLIKEAIEIDGRSYSSWDTMGMILRALKEYDEAETAINKAIEIDPEQVEPYIHKAQLLQDLDRSDETRSLAQSTIDKFGDTLTEKQRNQLRTLSLP
jgi:tetratricopeptide (TPR) repeat protein